MSTSENRCHYCCRFSDDVKDVELRPDGETWKKAYSSRICGRCREFLNQSRQFRYKRKSK